MIERNFGIPLVLQLGGGRHSPWPPACLAFSCIPTLVRSVQVGTGKFIQGLLIARAVVKSKPAISLSPYQFPSYSSAVASRVYPDNFFASGGYYLRGENHHAPLFPPLSRKSTQHSLSKAVFSTMPSSLCAFQVIPSPFSHGQGPRGGWALVNRYDCWEERIDSETPGQPRIYRMPFLTVSGPFHPNHFMLQP
jgi:hypothetical protein